MTLLITVLIYQLSQNFSLQIKQAFIEKSFENTLTLFGQHNNQILFQLYFMKIKTSDTFFPTRFRPTTANTNTDHHPLQSSNSRSYKLVKKRSSTQQSALSTNSQFQSVNIFKNNITAESQFNFQKQKPLGGVEIFMKQHNRKVKAPSNRKLSNRVFSPEGKKKQAQPQVKPSCFYSQKQDGVEEYSPLESKRKQQVFKSHQSYQPGVTMKTRLNQHRPNSNYSKSQQNKEYNNWVDKQTQNYQTKMSILNEIYYKKPLVERYGQKYFEYFLRNRFEDESAPPTYTHQIKSDAKVQTIMQDKFLTKLKRLNSNVRNFQKLVLKGKNFTNVKMRETNQNL